MSGPLLKHIYFLVLLFIIDPVAVHCQHNQVPVARFNFNNKSCRDEINKLEARIVGAGYARDRFWNKQSFETKFLAADSVMVGVTANKMNNPFTTGPFNDIEIYDRVLTYDEVQAPDPNRSSVALCRTLISLGISLFLLLFYFYIRYRVRAALKCEKNRWEQMNKLLENELRVHSRL